MLRGAPKGLNKETGENPVRMRRRKRNAWQGKTTEPHRSEPLDFSEKGLLCLYLRIDVRKVGRLASYSADCRAFRLRIPTVEWYQKIKNEIGEKQ